MHLIGLLSVCLLVRNKDGAMRCLIDGSGKTFTMFFMKVLEFALQHNYNIALSQIVACAVCYIAKIKVSGSVTEIWGKNAKIIKLEQYKQDICSFYRYLNFPISILF